MTSSISTAALAKRLCLAGLLAAMAISSIVSAEQMGGAAATRILARVNGEAITEGQILRRLKAVDPHVDKHRSDPDNWPRLVNMATEAEIRERLLLQAARTSGLVVSPEELASALERTKRMLGAERYNDMLAKHDASEADYAAFLKRRLLIDKYREKIAHGIAVDEERLRSYYNGHKSSFRTPVRVHLEMLDLQDGKSAMLVATKMRDGASLDALSRLDGVTRVKAGWVTQGEIKPDFWRQLKAARQGAVLETTERDDRVRITRVRESQPSRELSFQESKELIRQRLLKSHKQAMLDNWYEKARRTANIEIYREVKAGVGKAYR